MIKTQKIELIAILVLATIASIVHSQQIIADGCVQFSSGSCTRCKRQTHIYQGVCYKNMLGCLEYKTGNECSACESPTFVLLNGRCNAIGGEAVSIQLMGDLYKYGGAQDDNPGAMYGQSSFVPTTLQNVKTLQSFLALDTFVRRGQYGHYISRMSNPIYSVHFYKNSDTYSYKVLYHGSGGGLFLCIADVPKTYRVQLRSLTPISASNVIYNCWDYDTSGKCMRCKDGDHLENGMCYANYGGCIRYMENICLQCLDFYLLVQNRCTSDCMSVSDARSILHYETNKGKSTLEMAYGTSISMFYTTTVTITTKTVTTYTIGPINSSSSSPLSSSSSSLSSPLSSGSSPSSSIFAVSSSSNPISSISSSSQNVLVSGTNSGAASNIGPASTPTNLPSSKNTQAGSSTIIPSPSSSSSSSSSAGSNGIYVVDLNNNAYYGTTSNISAILNQAQPSNSINQNNANINSLAGQTTTNSANVKTQTNNNAGKMASTNSIPASLQSSIQIVSPTFVQSTSAFQRQVFTQPAIVTSNILNVPMTNSSSLKETQDYLYSILNNDKISVQSTSEVSNSNTDSHCKQVKNGQCVKCVQFYWKNQNGICEQLSMLCVEVNQPTGICTKCFQGYLLSQGRCLLKDLN